MHALATNDDFIITAFTREPEMPLHVVRAAGRSCGPNDQEQPRDTTAPHAPDTRRNTKPPHCYDGAACLVHTEYVLRDMLQVCVREAREHTSIYTITCTYIRSDVRTMHGLMDMQVTYVSSSIRPASGNGMSLPMGGGRPELVASGDGAEARVGAGGLAGSPCNRVSPSVRPMQ